MTINHGWDSPFRIFLRLAMNAYVKVGHHTILRSRLNDGSILGFNKALKIRKTSNTRANNKSSRNGDKSILHPVIITFLEESFHGNELMLDIYSHVSNQQGY